VSTEPTDQGPLSSLRGAHVAAVDARKLGRAVGAFALAALTVVAAILAVAGADKNAQINALRAKGVRINVTVSACVALLGGSGSNAAGYACRGTYTFRGHRYEEAIPGNVNLVPRSVVPAVIVPSDPALLSTVAEVHNDRASWHVFVVPAVLALLVAAAVAFVVFTRRRRLPERRVPGQDGGRGSDGRAGDRAVRQARAAG